MPEARQDIAQVRNLMLRSPSGVYLPLPQLADIEQEAGRYIVLHQGARRMQTVTCNVGGRSVDTFVAEAKRRIAAEIALPAASYVEFGGTAEAQARSRRDLLVHSLLAGLGIVLLLSIITGTGTISCLCSSICRSRSSAA